MGKVIKEGIYLHINNGGVHISVSNENGPTIEVGATHFGHVTNSMKLHVKKESLKELGELFLSMSEKEFDEPYYCAAENNKGVAVSEDQSK